MAIDRWVYTFCEQCCDCIPCIDLQGGELHEGGEIDETRWNCPLHYKADVCALYPDIRHYPGLPETTYDETEGLNPTVSDLSARIAEGEFGEGTPMCDFSRKYV